MEIIKSIKPLANRVITTAEVYDRDIFNKGIIVAAKGAVKEYQKVVAKGSMVRDIEVGDMVEIDPTAYERKMYDDNSLKNDLGKNPKIGVFIPVVEIDGVKHFSIYDRDIKYVVTLENIPDPEELQIPEVKIIKPKTPKIIL